PVLPPRRLVLLIDAGVLAMDTIYNQVCVIVTAASALTFVRGFSQPERSLLQSAPSILEARPSHGATGLFRSGPRRRSHSFACRLIQRTNRGGVRSRSGSGPVGRTGPWVCLSPDQNNFPPRRFVRGRCQGRESLKTIAFKPNYEYRPY